ncbi:putative transcriptional regulator [Tieghemostelium lacteum]|uniref:Putative transcriptional regulator n=1 Tax=Tieghemostelium lacteum TaxID=361077 RepID=A0A151ZCL2_TIELA|nr:putative transcriptional regulator [Tieghemostelium lacteum]|eukprot:KYQ91614.1 putative transcriptional regulator [Tieghemostelium lacteum]
MGSPMPLINISGGLPIVSKHHISGSGSNVKKSKFQISPPTDEETSPNMYTKKSKALNNANMSLVPCKVPQKINTYPVTPSSNMNTPIITNSHLNLNPNSTAYMINNTYSSILQVVEQESISTENVIINNRNASAHIVVKNTCFVVKIKSMDMNILNFSNNCLVKAALFYANEPLKEVSYIQTPPINYFGASTGQGEYFALDIKISILSSQHQGNMFYIMFYVSDPTKPTQQPYQVLSHPIRVVSKVDHIKKDGNGGCEKKQTFIDILTDRLTTLENIHMSQSNILSIMMKQRGLPFNDIVLTEFDDESIVQFTEGLQQKQIPKQQIPQPPPHNSNSKQTAERFLDSFNKVIKVYKKYKEDQIAIVDQNDQVNNNNNNILNSDPLLNELENQDQIEQQNKNSNSNSSVVPSSPKPMELAKFLDSLTESEKSILSDLLDSLTFNEPNLLKGQEENCQCDNCPHRKLFMEHIAYNNHASI